MRVLIVDDEVLARAVLRELLAAHPEVEIVGEAGNGFEAVKLADELAPDLLFLDIQMPKLSGFEVMELVPSAAAVAAAARPPGRPLERVLIREEGRVHVLPLAKIDFVEAKDDYLSFAVAGKRLQKQQTMGELEAQLDGGRFVRVHRSYLLNIDRLARLELYAKDSWIAILADGTRIPVSRSGHARLKELMG